MKKTILTLTLIAFATTALAQTVPQDGSQLETFKEAYNNQTEQVPGFVGNIVGGETINLRFKENSTTEKTIGAEFEGVKIENISESSLNDPTMKVNVTRTAVESMVESGQPYEELRTQLDENNIEYEATNTGAGIKLKVVETLGNLASMVGLSF